MLSDVLFDAVREMRKWQLEVPSQYHDLRYRIENVIYQMEFLRLELDSRKKDFDYYNLPELEVIRIKKLTDSWMDKEGVIGDEKYYLRFAKECAESSNKRLLEKVMKDDFNTELQEKMREAFSAELERRKKQATKGKKPAIKRKHPASKGKKS